MIDIEELPIIRAIDDILKREYVRDTLNSTISELERKLNRTVEAKLVWEPVPLIVYKDRLPGLILSSWIFILPADTDSGAERHPHSRQRMMSYRGRGNLQIRDGEEWRSNRLTSEPDAPIESRWVSIPPNTWHRAIVPAENWVVVSFHTATAEELIEERPEEDNFDFTKERKYL